MIWLVFAILTAGVILALTRSLNSSVATASGSEAEVNVYKLQLTELDRDEERAALSKEEADRTRAEIARRLLRANREGTDASGKGSGLPFSVNAAFAALALVVAISTLGLYTYFGNPALQDQPLEARLNAPPDKQPLDIQIANVERRLRANPRDGLGWSVIAPVYLRLGQFEKAADAFRNAMLINGEDEDKLLGLSEALTFANNGVMSDQAKLALKAALARNPKSLRARVGLAVLATQEERKADAEQIYSQLLNEDLPDDVKNILNDRLAALRGGPEKNAAAGKQEADGAFQGEQAAMIQGMVERLAERLKENKADLPGWLRLIRSYAVLKETDKAQEAATSARQQFASDAQALEQIETLTHGLGLASPSGNEGQPKS